jgi:hypothetical protein
VFGVWTKKKMFEQKRFFFSPKKLRYRRSYLSVTADRHNAGKQGCQIFLGTIYQTGDKLNKLTQHYQIAIKYSK